MKKQAITNLILLAALKEAIAALNTTPNFRLKGGRHKDSYTLLAELDKIVRLAEAEVK